MNLLSLNSVGSVLDMEDKIVYPQMTNGLPDLEMGVDLDECVEEWFESISDKDMTNLLDAVNPGWNIPWR